jgi:hypothetical protein
MRMQQFRQIINLLLHARQPILQLLPHLDIHAISFCPHIVHTFRFPDLVGTKVCLCCVTAGMTFFWPLVFGGVFSGIIIAALLSVHHN